MVSFIVLQVVIFFFDCATWHKTAHENNKVKEKNKTTNI